MGNIINMQFRTYMEFKHELDHEIVNQTEGFIRMGYLLKVARDTNILYESGYKSVTEFAQEEYHLSQDTVSRMMSINDRFSQGGYSMKIDDKYRRFGHTLLTDMLTMPDAIIEELPEDVTRAEIRELKKEIKEEEKITDIEVMLETPDEDLKKFEPRNRLEEALFTYYKGSKAERDTNMDAVKQRYKALHLAVFDQCLNEKTMKRALFGGDTGRIGTRIKGYGAVSISSRAKGADIVLMNVRTMEKETYSMSDLMSALCGLTYSQYPEKDWEWLYGEPFEEKKEEKKEKKTTEQKTEKSVQKTKEGVQKNAKSVSKEEKTIQKGSEAFPMQEPVEDEKAEQASILDMPEVLPEGYEPPEPEDRTGEAVQAWNEAAKKAQKCVNILIGNQFEWTSKCEKNMEKVQEMAKEMWELAGKIREIVREKN